MNQDSIMMYHRIFDATDMCNRVQEFKNNIHMLQAYREHLGKGRLKVFQDAIEENLSEIDKLIDDRFVNDQQQTKEELWDRCVNIHILRTNEVDKIKDNILEVDGYIKILDGD